MGEKLATRSHEMDDAEVARTIEDFEAQFSPEVPIARRAIFGDQMMETRDLASLPVASGGPTWSQSGMTKDPTDGDNDFHQQF